MKGRPRQGKGANGIAVWLVGRSYLAQTLWTGTNCVFGRRSLLLGLDELDALHNLREQWVVLLEATESGCGLFS